jgi:formiminoglutamase
MSLNEYLEPVSLEKPEGELLVSQNLFCRNITIHTADNPIGDLSKYKVALIGVPEARACSVDGIELAPDVIRNKLYQLNFIEKKLPVIDLGNLIRGKELKDTYFGLRDVVLELLQFNILPVIMGGSQDLTYGLFLALEYLNQAYTLATVDYKIDLAFESYEKITNKNYLNTILLENKHLFEYLNIGQQACFAAEENYDLFENLFHESIRLGLLRNNIPSIEPYLRDASILSIDFSALKHADAPGQEFASPNGFNAEDICQIARYAGFGEKLKVIGIFDICPLYDHNNVTSGLAAQAIWYMLEGYSQRIGESPSDHPEEFKKFIISYDETNKLTFFKSLLTNRWWCEVPSNNSQSRVISCTESDYINACNREIPDRWLKILKKLN